MPKDFTPTRPAANIIWSREPDGDIDFNDKESSFGVWPGRTKKGDAFLKIKSPSGHKGLLFFNTREGWKLVKSNPEPKEEW